MARTKEPLFSKEEVFSFLDRFHIKGMSKKEIADDHLDTENGREGRDALYRLLIPRGNKIKYNAAIYQQWIDEWWSKNDMADPENFTATTYEPGTTHTILQHEGKKYLRLIHSALEELPIHVDVYEVLVAFEVHNPAIAHAIKKLLAAGRRGKGDIVDDLKGVLAAVNRAIDIEERKI